MELDSVCDSHLHLVNAHVSHCATLSNMQLTHPQVLGVDVEIGQIANFELHGGQRFQGFARGHRNHGQSTKNERRTNQRLERALVGQQGDEVADWVIGFVAPCWRLIDVRSAAKAACSHHGGQDRLLVLRVRLRPIPFPNPDRHAM